MKRPVLCTPAALAFLGRRAHPRRELERKLLRGGHEAVALWHGDAGYDTGDPTIEGDRHRLLMLPDGWRYEPRRP